MAAYVANVGEGLIAIKKAGAISLLAENLLLGGVAHEIGFAYIDWKRGAGDAGRNDRLLCLL